MMLNQKLYRLLERDRARRRKTPPRKLGNQGFFLAGDSVNEDFLVTSDAPGPLLSFDEGDDDLFGDDELEER